MAESRRGDGGMRRDGGNKGALADASRVCLLNEERERVSQSHTHTG